MMIIISVACLLTLFPSSSHAVDDAQLLAAAREIFNPLPDKPVFRDGKQPNEARLKLGLMLYFDRRLSKSGAISCASCHNLATAGVDNLPVSIGHRWQTGTRNAPTTLNAALHISQFWDGRAEDVEEQALMPIINPMEMAASPDLVENRLGSIPEYVKLFNEAFPESDDPLTINNVAEAIGAFERTLLTPSRFDTFLEGDTEALTADEKKGLEIFITTGCSICHSGVGIGGGVYQRFGVLRDPGHGADKGRYDVTEDESDLYVFKVPSLRNVTRTYPYFHDGREWSLKEAVKIMAKAQLGVNLDDEKMTMIVTFLESLEGAVPEIAAPILPPSSASTPKPVIK